MIKQHVFIVLLFISTLGRSQMPIAESLNKRFPSQPIVYTLKQADIDITNDEKGLKVVNHIKEQYVVINEQGKNFNTQSVYSNSFVEIKNIKATNYVLNGSKYSKINVDDIKIEDANSGESFYDGSKKITIKYPNSNVGSLIDIEYDEVFNEPRFFGSHYISEYYPVLKSSCSLKCPSSVVVNIRDFNISDLKITQSAKVSKTHKVYSWEIDSVPAFKREEHSPNFRTLASYFLFNIKEYQKDGKTIPLVGSVDNLFHWYLDLVKNLNKTESPHLQQITDSLVAKCSTNEEKLKAIYYWVQDKIAYIAYEDGLGGYIPREADIICKRRFGDCKDMASILFAMGKAAKLPIYLTWIGSRDIPYQFTEVPAPMAANHMIAAYITKDTCLFLDATGKHQDLGVHTSFIQGKEAIVGITDNEYRVIKVPVISHAKTYLKDSVTIKISNQSIIGSGIIKVDGYKKVNMQNYISGKSYKEQFEYFSSYSQKGNNKFKLDTFIVLQNKRDLPVIVSYKFRIPNYVTETSTELFTNLNFDKNYMEEYSTKDRKYGFEFNFPFTKTLIVRLELDNKTTIKYVPDNALFNKDNLEYNASYTKTTNSVEYRSNIKVKDKDVSPLHFEVWDEFMSEQAKQSNKTVGLIK